MGTDIAEKFALRIFETFAGDQSRQIELEQYLKYIDIYHYGEESERSLITFNLMAKSNKNTVNYQEFEDYITLIIAAITKVHPSASDNLLTQREIEMLFGKIANNKDSFGFKDFERIYSEKPELLSWIDYFKNNDEEVLCMLHRNIREMLSVLGKFCSDFPKNLKEVKFNSKLLVNLEKPIDAINKFSNFVKKKKKHFIQNVTEFSIRDIFENLTNNNEHDKSPLNLRDSIKKNIKNTPHSRKHSTENINQFRMTLTKSLAPNNILTVQEVSEDEIASDDRTEVYQEMVPNEPSNYDSENCKFILKNSRRFWVI